MRAHRAKPPAGAVEGSFSKSPASKDPRPSLLAGVVASVTGAPPLPRAPSPLSRRFQQVCATAVSEVLGNEDVAQLEYSALIYVELEPGIEQRRLAEAIGIDPSHATFVVDRLCSKGLIERRVSAEDRRIRELHLTNRGKVAWRRIYPKAKAANARVLAPLTPPEREMFLDFLIRIIEA